MKSKNKMDVYQMVTDRIIEELKKGNIPWHKPWVISSDYAFNRISNKKYSLLNQILLHHSGEYATFKQWAELGGKVKKGEKAEQVVFWKMLEVKKDVDDIDENIKINIDADEKDKEKKLIPLLRYYNVFHISQIEGVEPIFNHSEDKKEIKGIDEIDKIISNYATRTELKIEECFINEAYYSYSLDMIKIPKKKQFDNIESFYGTIFHELGHSTGHERRLNRKMNFEFGTKGYSNEELIAELVSAVILKTLGIETNETFKNNAAYIQSWIRVLENDNRLIVNASGKAEKAVNLILNMKNNE